MAVVLQRYLARQRHKSAFALTAGQPSDTRSFNWGGACSNAETSESKACEAYVLSWGIKYQQKTSARQRPTGECIVMADLSETKNI